MARESAVIVAVPEAEAVVGEWRATYDPSASAGVPAHITLLYPFVDAGSIDAVVVDRLGAIFGRFVAFDYSLGGPSRFGDAVLWLAPDPADCFSALTEAIVEAFGIPPYGGAYEEPTPHLTVVDASSGAGADAFDRAREALTPALPITARAHEARLIEQDDHLRWRTRATFALAAGR